MPPRQEQPFEYRRPDGLALRGLLLPAPSPSDPLIVFLSGFRSVHSGHKASAVAAWAASHGCGCLRFDHLGHGISDGPFERFRIGRGIADAAAAIASVAQPEQPVVVVGSSMGGWMGLEIARRRLLPVAGLLLIAPATEFVSRRMEGLSGMERLFLKLRGYVDLPDRYEGGTYQISHDFLLEALASEPPSGLLDLPCPVEIFHGSDDESVPVASGRRLAARIAGATWHEIPGGDHRLNMATEAMLAGLARLSGRG